MWFKAFKRWRYIKQCRPWSDCSKRSSLLWVCTVCSDSSSTATLDNLSHNKMTSLTFFLYKESKYKLSCHRVFRNLVFDCLKLDVLNLMTAIPNTMLEQYWSQLILLWYLSQWRPATAQASLCIRAVSLQPLLFAYMKYGSIRRVRPQIRHLIPLNCCACVLKEWVILSWDGSI